MCRARVGLTGPGSETVKIGETRRGRDTVREWLRTNQGIGTILTLLLGAFLIYLQLSPWVHRKLRDGFTLGFFPVVGVVLMMFFSAALIFGSRRKQSVGELDSITGKALLFCSVLVLGCWVYFELMLRIGFLLVSPIFLLVFVYTLGMGSWRNSLLAGVIMTVVVYAVFRLLGITLPPGILPS